MRKLLLIAWRAALGAAGGLILAVLGILTQALPLTSGVNSGIAASGYGGMLVGALAGGLWGWYGSRANR